MLSDKHFECSPSISLVSCTPIDPLLQLSPHELLVEPEEYKGRATKDIIQPKSFLDDLEALYEEECIINLDFFPSEKNLGRDVFRNIEKITEPDCQVHIGNKKFCCHLMTLQINSKHFEGAPKDRVFILQEKDVSSSVFGFIYKWMLKDRVEDKIDYSAIILILKAAIYLNIKELIEQCWGFINDSKVYTEETAFLLYKIAREYNFDIICDLMIPRIQLFFFELVSSKDWLELSLDIVLKFLKSNQIYINSEMEVFMSAIRWLKHDYEKRNKHKLELMSCIRFGNMFAQQLIRIKLNPESFDCVDLVQDPEIYEMITSGLDYRIFEECNTGFGRRDYTENFNIPIPQPRNWSGKNKTYLCNMDFLFYLDQLRRARIGMRE